MKADNSLKGDNLSARIDILHDTGNDDPLRIDEKIFVVTSKIRTNMLYSLTE